MKKKLTLDAKIKKDYFPENEELNKEKTESKENLENKEKTESKESLENKENNENKENIEKKKVKRIMKIKIIIKK